MAVPKEILQLVETFERNKGAYNETQLRQEFINPLFMGLGWDVNNRAGYAEAYKDVIHEDSIKIGGATKAPDYCFSDRRGAEVFPGSEKAVDRYQA